MVIGHLRHENIKSTRPRKEDLPLVDKYIGERCIVNITIHNFTHPHLIGYVIWNQGAQYDIPCAVHIDTCSLSAYLLFLLFSFIFFIFVLISGCCYNIKILPSILTITLEFSCSESDFNMIPEQLRFNFN